MDTLQVWLATVLGVAVALASCGAVFDWVASGRLKKRLLVHLRLLRARLVRLADADLSSVRVMERSPWMFPRSYRRVLIRTSVLVLLSLAAVRGCSSRSVLVDSHYLWVVAVSLLIYQGWAGLVAHSAIGRLLPATPSPSLLLRRSCVAFVLGAALMTWGAAVTIATLNLLIPDAPGLELLVLLPGDLESWKGAAGAAWAPYVLVVGVGAAPSVLIPLVGMLDALQRLVVRGAVVLADRLVVRGRSPARLKAEYHPGVRIAGLCAACATIATAIGC